MLDISITTWYNRQCSTTGHISKQCKTCGSLTTRTANDQLRCIPTPYRSLSWKGIESVVLFRLLVLWLVVTAGRRSVYENATVINPTIRCKHQEGCDHSIRSDSIHCLFVRSLDKETKTVLIINHCHVRDDPHCVPPSLPNPCRIPS